VIIQTAARQIKGDDQETNYFSHASAFISGKQKDKRSPDRPPVMIHPIEQVQLELCHLTHKRKTETLKKRPWARGFMALFAIVLAMGLALAACPAAAAPFLYVTNIGDNTVSVIDTATNTKVAAIPVGSFPDGLAIGP
jgi:YVTN family beta-propeller protein